MNSIHKKLQIEQGSYGTLCIDANARTRSFEITIMSYVNCGGNHQHNSFNFKTIKDAIKVASILYDYGTYWKKAPKEDNELIYLEQEHTCRGVLRLTRSKKMVLGVGMEYNGGSLNLDMGQARKVAGYIFYWSGVILIGTRKVKQPPRTELVFDI